MAAGKIIILNASTAADADGICAGQTAKTLTINGSLTSGGHFAESATNWAHKIKIVSAGDESANTFTLTGIFYASNTLGDTTATMQIIGGNATSVTSALYAREVSAIVAGTITASSVTVGTSGDCAPFPVTLSDGSLYQIIDGGVFSGASLTLQRYQADLDEWVDVDETKTAADVVNYEIPVGTIVRANTGSVSTTSMLGIVAEAINKTR